MPFVFRAKRVPLPASPPYDAAPYSVLPDKIKPVNWIGCVPSPLVNTPSLLVELAAKLCTGDHAGELWWRA